MHSSEMGPGMGDIPAMEAEAEYRIHDTSLATQSEERAKMFVQDIGTFEQYETNPVTGDRLPPTPEQEALMDKRLRSLHDLFDGADFPWRLDGGLNISIYQKAYIGNHKDIDVSFPDSSEELNHIDDWLGSHGFGMFISEPHPEKSELRKHNLQRIAGRHIQPESITGRHVLIAAIDHNGRIQLDQQANFLDVHINPMNSEGAILTSTGSLPPEWTAAQPRLFHGIELPTSHPALTTFYKLHETRSYDQKDVEKIVASGALTQDDVDLLGEVMARERQSVLDRVEVVLTEIVDHIRPEMTVDEASEVFTAHPEVAKNIARGMDPSIVHQAVEVMMTEASAGHEAMIKATQEHLGMKARFLVWDENFRRLQKAMENKGTV